MATVRYAFDPGKDRLNLGEHGVSLALAELLFAGPFTTMADDRFDYGGFAPSGSFKVAFSFACSRIAERSGG
jgi:hypothetical protein